MSRQETVRSERILVVTGSRALADTPAAERWSRDRLRAALAFWEPTLLVHGGCPDSPDVWAHQLSACPATVYYADGRRVEYAERSTGEFRSGPYREQIAAGSWLSQGEKAHPLTRNDRMIDEIAARKRNGADVLVVGLTASWSRTHGSEYTLHRAECAGLRFVRRAAGLDVRGEIATESES